MSSNARASRIRLRPRHDVIHISRGRTVLATDLEGRISSDSPRQGLFVYQTRMLSRYRWTIQRRQPKLSTQSAVEQHSWLGYYYDSPPNCKEIPSGNDQCNPLQQTIELRISRVVGEGMHEDVEVCNHTQVPTSISLSLEVNADFASRSEIKDGRKQNGKLQKQWNESDGEYSWRFQYTCEHHYDHQGNSGTARLDRAITLHLHSDSAPKHSADTITFQIELAPHQAWKACLKWQPEIEGVQLPIEPECNALTGSAGEYSRKTEAFLREATQIQTGTDDLTASVQRVINRSRLDVASLRLFDLDEGDHNWKLAAGIPTYLALFGRDLLASAWQASLLSNDMVRGALSIHARMQATDYNDWRGAQPGRMIHEAHTDPLSILNFTPQALYFGSITSPFLYPICVSELWHWSGDKEAVQPYIRPALDALAWADKFSRDANGLYKYKTISDQGMKNQAWKDSSDAIVYPEGSQVENPLGTCEMQAFAFVAKRQMAETLCWFDEPELAKRLYAESQELKETFNDRFWMDDVGYVAMAIDKNNEMVKTIASDPGHCLLSGILRDEYVSRVAHRMMQPDMFSGWGIRTLSSDHPAYNPFAYHRGTVWPVENGAFVLGMARYGLRGEMWQLARALLEAATLFDYDRLPEVFGGHTRDNQHPFPCLYERADSPQAWSASVPFLILQALLGLYPYAPLKVLFVDPWLPEWLPDVRIENLEIGGAHLSLRFTRNENGRTDYSVEELRGELHVLRQPSPWSFTAGWGERVKDAVLSLLPRK